MSGKCGYERQAEQLATARTARAGFAELLSYRHCPSWLTCHPVVLDKSRISGRGIDVMGDMCDVAGDKSNWKMKAHFRLRKSRQSDGTRPAVGGLAAREACAAARP